MLISDWFYIYCALFRRVVNKALASVCISQEQCSTALSCEKVSHGMIFYNSVLTHQNYITHLDFSPENKIRVQHQKGLQAEPEPCLLGLCDSQQSPPLTKLAALVSSFCKMGLITNIPCHFCRRCYYGKDQRK